MKRLQGKCFVASAGLHLLLVLTLLLGSAFRGSPPDPKVPSPGAHRDGPLLELTSPPQSEAPAVAAAQPSPVLAPQPKVVSQDIHDLAPKLRDPDSFISMGKRPKTPHISTNLVSRPVLEARPTATRQKSTAEIQADQIGQALDRIGKALSPGTAIDLGSDTGFGTGSYSYAQIVKEHYSHNWDPQNFTTEEGTGVATVVIGSDGKVLRARLITSSGNRALDASIQQALSRVQSLQPFEPGAREKQRTYTIDFNTRARSLLP